MRYGQQSDRSIPDVAYMDSYLLFFLGWSAISTGCGVGFGRVGFDSQGLLFCLVVHSGDCSGL